MIYNISKKIRYYSYAARVQDPRTWGKTEDKPDFCFPHYAIKEGTEITYYVPDFLNVPK